MGFNRENYKRIKEEYDGKYLRAAEQAQLKRAEVHTKIPAVALIDRELAGVGVKIFEASLSGDSQKLDAIYAENRRMIEKRKQLLMDAGYPANYTDIKYECAECGDTGVVEYRMCKCMREKLIKAGLESSGMYSLVMSQSFENFDLDYYRGEGMDRMRAIYDIARNFAETFEPEKSGSILMLGSTGLGKTHLSSAIGKVVIEKGNDVYYTTSMGMFSDFEMSRFGNSTAMEATGETEKYYTCDLLIIDDLGTEVINQFTTSCLYNVINMRLNRKKSTIINTNFNRDDMRRKYQDRITSRIFGEYKIFPFTGIDIREQKLLK